MCNNNNTLHCSMTGE